VKAKRNQRTINAFDADPSTTPAKGLSLYHKVSEALRPSNQHALRCRTPM